jgi:hypothetical protein
VHRAARVDAPDRYCVTGWALCDRGRRSLEVREGGLHIALLIDCENASAERINGVLSELASRGTVNIRRAYGNWKNSAS